MAQVGDTVRFLNTTGGGKITRIDGTVAYVDDDGFETPVLLKELVVVASAGDRSMMQTDTPAAAAPAQPKQKQPKAQPQEPSIPFVETADGEKLNIELAFAPADIKKLSSTTYDAFVVNDSNYHIFLTVLTRGDADQDWTLRFAGEIEPAMQEWLWEVDPADLPAMDRIAVQCVAFKRGRAQQLKAPISIDQKFAAIKFFKLHCFRPDRYFSEPVISLPVVTDDRPAGALEIDARSLEQAIKEKSRADRRQPKPLQKQRKAQSDEPLVVDLHIAELVDSTAGMGNADMLNLQIDKFREVMDANLRHPGQKIVFIHGKGEGVLRKALLKELNYRYKGHDVQDASFREYGFGATQVTIKQLH